MYSKKVQLETQMRQKSKIIQHKKGHMKPYVVKSSGDDPVPKPESSFEDWKLEYERLKAAIIYTDISIA